MPKLPRNLLTLLVALLASPAAFAASLVVEIEEAPAAGTLVVEVYNSANAFGDFRGAYREVSHDLSVSNSLTIDDLPAGTYAVLAYIDENENATLDRNFIGIPKERVGISNDYRPKGPPVFERASFELYDSEPRVLSISLYKVLGERGRLGLGVGVIGQSSPYAGSSETVLQPIPAITYNGERLQWVGPNIQYGIVGEGKLRLAASATYRIGAYEEDDSPVLEGLGDRESTLLAGLGLRYDLPGGVNALIRYEHDVLDRIGGGQGRLRFSKGFQAGIFRFVPQLSVNWLSSDLANHEFGVPEDGATPERPAYDVGSTTSVEAGFGSFIELTEDWRIVLNLSAEFFGDSISDSPIVDSDVVYRGFAAITYVF